MSMSALAAGLRQLRRQLAGTQSREDSDEQLLFAFINRRDDNAFAALVHRHGPMVLQVCRRLLGHEQDAEDAFQAVFLVLARNAAALRKKGSLASFLHGTAYRLARDARRSAARRRKHEGQAPSRPPANPADELSWREVRTLLDEEIARLPEIYRSVFVLCHLEQLSRAEAAQRLGLKEYTVLSRLAKARKRLAQRLARRGVELTAILAATAMATPMVSAVPVRLMASTIQAALATAAGEGLSGIVSASVAQLVQSATTAMMVSKAKTAALILMAVTLLGGAGAWAYRGLAPNVFPPSEPPATAADDKPQAIPSKREATKTLEIHGRVFAPDGKPKAGAKLLLAGDDQEIIDLGSADAEGHVKIIELGVTAADGRFSVSVLKQAKHHWLIAQTDDAGFDFCCDCSDRRNMDKDVELHLVKDQPIRGRVVNTEGKPIAGVSVSAYEVNIYPNNSLDQFLAHWKNQRGNDNPLHGERLSSIVAAAVFKTATDAEGRFVLRGLGVERFVSLHLTAAGLADTEAWIVTRPGFDAKSFNKEVLDNRPKSLIRLSGIGRQLEGAELTVVAEPEKILRGVVKESDSGKGRPGVWVQLTRKEGEYILDQKAKARTDAQGRFEIHRAHKAKRYMLEVAADAAAGYMPCQVWADDTPGYPPITVDIAVKKGVLVTGKIIDKTSSKPIKGSVRIVALPNNPFIKEFPQFDSSAWYTTEHTGEDGVFRTVTIPGPVLLMGSPNDSRTEYKAPFPDPKYPEYFKRMENGSLDYCVPGGGFSPVMGNYCKVLVVKPDAKVVQQDIVLERASSLIVRAEDGEGKLLHDFWVGGSRPGAYYSAYHFYETDCPVYEVEPDRPRMLTFFHPARKLAGTLTLKGDEKGPVVKQLSPAASIKGRLLDEDGKPLARIVVHMDYQMQAASEIYNALHGTFHRATNLVVTSADGAFAFDDVIGQQKFQLSLRRGRQRFERAAKPANPTIEVKSGESRDLGAIKIKPESAAEPQEDKADDEPQADPPRREAADTREIHGRVLAPDGKPKAGAKLRLLGKDKKIDELGITAVDGSFSVSVPKEAKDRYLIAQANDTGFDGFWLGSREAEKPAELRLVKDQPIRGRIVNTEGKPVAGVSVAVNEVNIYPNNSLDWFLNYWKNRRNHDNPLGGGGPDGAADALFATTTDAEGRFILRGVGVERFVKLQLQKVGIADTELWIVTRPGFDPNPINKMILDNTPKEDLEIFGKGRQLHGSEVTAVAEAEKILRGCVKEADTGKGRPNVVVHLFRMLLPDLETQTDAEGRYEFHGAHKAKSYTLEVRSDPASGYVGCQVQADDTPGYQPITVDLHIKRGVIITGKIIDQATGKPVDGFLRLAPLKDNAFVKNYPGFESAAWNSYGTTDANGVFRVVAIPGPILLMGGPATTYADFKYKPSKVDPKYRQYFLERPNYVAYYRLSGGWTPVNGIFFTVLQIKPDARVVEQDVVLERLPGLTVQIQDGESKPLTHAYVAGLTAEGHYPMQLAESSCTAYGIGPDKPRVLIFYHLERKLAASITFKGDEKPPVIVKLGPAGAIKGRLLDGDGKAMSGVRIDPRYHHPSAATMYRATYDSKQIVTDAEGAFTFEDVIPGFPFDLAFRRGQRRFARETKTANPALRIEAGECRNLGAMKLKLFAE